MKYQEALNNVRKVYVESDHYDEEDIRLLQELVDKEEKPVGRKFVEDNGIFSSHYRCPKCNKKVSPICLYCENCGQKFKVEE